MSYNSKQLKVQSSAKKLPKPKDVIYDPMGQWKFPGQITKIPSGNITMQGVPYPVLGKDNLGNEIMMQTDKNYQFPGTSVTEYPQFQKGGDYNMLGYALHHPIGALKHFINPEKYHATDEYKRPNHITFSDESKYSNQEHKGGHWEKQNNGTWTFTPSSWNIKNAEGYDKLQDWWSQNEGKSGNILLPPSDDPQIKLGGWLNSYKEEYKKGGQKGLKKFTSKNIQTSLNDIMQRNTTLFGPSGKKRYKPDLNYKYGGWLEQYQIKGPVSTNKIGSILGDDGRPMINVQPEVVIEGENSWLDKLKTTLNPYNWGVDDYTKSGTKDQAFNAARKAGEKEYMWNNKRYNTNYAGTPEQQLKETGITNEQLFKQNKVQERLYNNLVPVGYINMEERVIDAVIKNKKDPQKEIGWSVSDDRTDAYNFYMGKPQKNNTFSISKYKPSISENKDDIYYSLNEKRLPNEMLDMVDEKGDLLDYSKVRSSNEGPYSNPELTKRLWGNSVMGNFTVSKGEDERGRYLSYYDKWDIAPMDFGKPYEIYDRVYHKDYGDGKQKRMYYSDKELSALDANKKDFDTQGLQRELNNRGYQFPRSTTSDNTFDGVWGQETQKALLDWQNKNKKKKYGGNSNSWLDQYQGDQNGSETGTGSTYSWSPSGPYGPVKDVTSATPTYAGIDVSERAIEQSKLRKEEKDRQARKDKITYDQSVGEHGKILGTLSYAAKKGDDWANSTEPGGGYETAGKALEFAAMSAMPLFEGVGLLKKPITTAAKWAFNNAVKSASKLKLPTYQNSYQWQADQIPSWLSEAGETLTPEQKLFTGKWHTTDIRDVPFYIRTRPGSGNVNIVRMSTKNLENLENNMPGAAKGMSGKKTPIVTSTTNQPGELIIPNGANITSNKSFRFDVNPFEYVPQLGKIEPTSPWGKYHASTQVSEFLKDMVGSQYPSILGMPRKYFPFKQGGEKWLDQYQDAGSVAKKQGLTQTPISLGYHGPVNKPTNTIQEFQQFSKQIPDINKYGQLLKSENAQKLAGVKAIEKQYPGIDVAKASSIYDESIRVQPQGVIKTSAPRQGAISKGLEIAANPFSAIDQIRTSGYVPDYFTQDAQADFNPMNLAYQALTPAGWYSTGANAIYNKMPVHATQGDWKELAWDALEAIPLSGKTAKLAKTYIPQTYKVNPWAFKPNPEAYYRGIGRTGLDDALESKIIRPTKNYDDLYVTDDIRHTNMYASDKGTSVGDPFATDDSWRFIEAKDPKKYIAEIPKDKLTTAKRVSEAVYPDSAPYYTTKDFPSIDDVKIYKQDWLQGYKPIEVPKQLPGSPNAVASSDNVGKGIKQTSNKIDQTIIDDYTKQEINWLNSEEYIKRNMAATGKTRKAVIKETDKIIKQVNKTTLNTFDDKADMAAGVYVQDKNKPIINLFNTGNEKQLLNTADHEIKHAVSQQAIRSNDGLIDLVTNPYKKYPTVNVKKWYDNFIPGETTSKWASNAPEQQVVSKRIMDLVEKTQGVKRGTQLTDDNIKSVIDLLNKEIKNGNPQNSDIIAMLSSFKSKFGKNYYPIVKDMVNKAYVVPAAIIGEAALQQKKYGGAIKKVLKKDVNHNEKSKFVNSQNSNWLNKYQ